MEAVLLTRLDKAFDRKLAEAFLREGYRVFALGAERAGGCGAGAAIAGCEGGEGGAGAAIAGVTTLPGDLAEARAAVEKEAGKLDIYVELSDERNAADCFTVRDGLDEALIRGLYDENVLRPMATLEAFITLLDAGIGKRLCFIASAEASINEARGVSGYGYALGKAAMSNFYQMISNKLTPSGYSFRVYDPMHGQIGAEASAEGALNYFIRRRGTEGEDPLRDDEARLVFRDAFAREHAW